MEREYTLTIKAENLTADNKSPIASDGMSGAGSTESKGLLTKEGAAAFAVGFAAYKTVKSFATQVINYKVSTVSLRTGSNELQQRADFINEVAQKGLGILETTTAGALVGGLPGALVGLAIGSLHTAVGFIQNQDKINLQYELEQETIQRNIIRAGARGSRYE